MASGQQQRRQDLKAEQTRRQGIEDTARGQVNNFLGGLNGVNGENRNLYLGVLGQTMQPGQAERTISSGLGGYFGTPTGPYASSTTAAPTVQMPTQASPTAPKFFRYADDPVKIYRSDGSHVADPETFFAEGGNRDWSGIDTIDRPSDGVLPWLRPSATPTAVETPAKPVTGGPLTETPQAPTYNLSDERANRLKSYFDPNSPTAGQVPSQYLPTGQLARRRQMREETNRGATTFSRNYMNPNLRGLADEQSDRESAQDEALGVSGARAGYDQMMRGELTGYDEARRGELQTQADRDLQRLLSTLGITSGMSGQSQGLYGGLLGNNLNAASGNYYNAAQMYDQARQQQGQGWMQALNAGLGAGTSLLGGYLMRPSSGGRPPAPVPPRSVSSGNPYFYGGG